MDFFLKALKDDCAEIVQDLEGLGYKIVQDLPEDGGKPAITVEGSNYFPLMKAILAFVEDGRFDIQMTAKGHFIRVVVRPRQWPLESKWEREMIQEAVLALAKRRSNS